MSVICKRSRRRCLLTPTSRRNTDHEEYADELAKGQDRSALFILTTMSALSSALDSLCRSNHLKGNVTDDDEIAKHIQSKGSSRYLLLSSADVDPLTGTSGHGRTHRGGLDVRSGGPKGNEPSVKGKGAKNAGKLKLMLGMPADMLFEVRHTHQRLNI